MYTDDFYDAYEKYLSEPAVRLAHDWMLQIVARNVYFQSVVDFGCGRFHEFDRSVWPISYIGIDANASPPNIKADYRTYDLQRLLGRTSFVSLFSTEITAPFVENYQFYERVFTEASTMQVGLVSGFFYAKNKSEVIEEAGGIKSYQTLERIEDVVSPVFTEKRIVMPVPSAMFGEDVFEVWKLLEKRHGLR